MIVLHHLNNSRSHRILWLLEELQLDYKIQYYRRDPLTMLAPPELKKIHPLGKSPVLTDGERVVAESAVIIDYLLERYGQGRLKPTDPDRYKYWMHYSEGSLMPVLLLNLIFRRIPTQPMPFFVKPIARGICEKVMKALVTPQTKTHLNFIEAELGKSTWFAGNEFSAADVQMSFPIEAAAGRIDDFAENWPRQAKFIERIRERTAYLRAAQREKELS